TPFPAVRHTAVGMPENPFDAPPVEELAFPEVAPREVSKPFDVPDGTGSGDSALVLTPLAQPPTNAKLPFQTGVDLAISAALHSMPTSPSEAAGTAAALSTIPTGTTIAGESREPVLVAKSESGIVPLGQIENSFIVAADGGALLIVDQHVAHERILFEKV